MPFTWECDLWSVQVEMGLPIIRIVLYWGFGWGLYWGPAVLGKNYYQVFRVSIGNISIIILMILLIVYYLVVS